MCNEWLSGLSLYCFGPWSQLCPAPLSSPDSLVYSDGAVIPNSAKDWELGCPGWKSSCRGSSTKDFGDYNGTESAVGSCLALSLAAGTLGNSLTNSASVS